MMSAGRGDDGVEGGPAPDTPHAALGYRIVSEEDGDSEDDEDASSEECEEGESEDEMYDDGVSLSCDGECPPAEQRSRNRLAVAAQQGGAPGALTKRRAEDNGLSDNVSSSDSTASPAASQRAVACGTAVSVLRAQCGVDSGPPSGRRAQQHRASAEPPASADAGECAVAAAISAVVSVAALQPRCVPNMVRYFVTPSAFPKFRKETVSFCNTHDDMSRHPVTWVDKTASNRLVYFKIHRAVRHSCVMGAMKRAGLKETKRGHWNICWGKRLKDEEYAMLNPFQKVNHFPGTWNIGRKDALVRGVSRMRRQVGSAFSFIPQTFLLPHDAALLQAEMARCPGQPFIVKPPASSCGKGIYLINNVADMPKSAGCLVQKYIANPLTIGGYKCDLRLYVAVTSYDPLRIYIFRDGLVRFATEKLKKGDSHLGNRYMHLTNYSVNRKSSQYQRNTCASKDDTGSKWSLKGLARYLTRRGHDWDSTWGRIKDVVTKTFITCESTVVSKIGMYVKNRNTCFELYGFDILLTSGFVPYLLEVNIMPALTCSSPLDRQIKNAVVSNLLHLVGLQPFDRQAYSAEEESRRKVRLLGFSSATHPTHTSAAPGSIQPNNIATSNLGTGRGSRRHSTEPAYSGTASAIAAAAAAGATSLDGAVSYQGAVPKPEPIDFSQIGEFELQVIRDAEDEYCRRGGFERVFPTRVSCELYGSFFDTTRYCNTLLGQWEKEKAQCSEATRRQLLRWLQGHAPYPRGRDGKAGPPAAQHRRASLPQRYPLATAARARRATKANSLQSRSASAQLCEREAPPESPRDPHSQQQGQQEAQDPPRVRHHSARACREATSGAEHGGGAAAQAGALPRRQVIHSRVALFDLRAPKGGGGVGGAAAAGGVSPKNFPAATRQAAAPLAVMYREKKAAQHSEQRAAHDRIFCITSQRGGGGDGGVARAPLEPGALPQQQAAGVGGVVQQRGGEWVDAPRLAVGSSGTITRSGVVGGPPLQQQQQRGRTSAGGVVGTAVQLSAGTIMRNPFRPMPNVVLR